MCKPNALNFWYHVVNSRWKTRWHTNVRRQPLWNRLNSEKKVSFVISFKLLVGSKTFDIEVTFLPLHITPCYIFFDHKKMSIFNFTLHALKNLPHLYFRKSLEGRSFTLTNIAADDVIVLKISLFLELHVLCIFSRA